MMVTSSTASIFITTDFEGFHCWPDAPLEVSFLRAEHRHKFMVKAEIEVFEDDRDLEFFIEQRALKNIFAGESARNSQSCEMMARSAATILSGRYGHIRRVSVTVSEDGENGATINIFPVAEQ